MGVRPTARRGAPRGPRRAKGRSKLHQVHGLRGVYGYAEEPGAPQLTGEALVRALSVATPEAIRLLPPEDRPGLYERLDLEVKKSPEGYRVSGMFCAPEPLSF